MHIYNTKTFCSFAFYLNSDELINRDVYFPLTFLFYFIKIGH